MPNFSGLSLFFCTLMRVLKLLKTETRCSHGVQLNHNCWYLCAKQVLEAVGPPNLTKFGKHSDEKLLLNWVIRKKKQIINSRQYILIEVREKKNRSRSFNVKKLKIIILVWHNWEEYGEHWKKIIFFTWKNNYVVPVPLGSAFFCLWFRNYFVETDAEPEPVSTE